MKAIKILFAIYCAFIITPVKVALALESDQAGSGTIWHELRDDMRLADQYNHPLIEQEIRWLTDNPDYLHRVTRRSEPYIHYIFNRVISAGIPAEIALLPIVESAYDPFAYSPGRAAGLWQFIPATARHFDLQQDWWYDGRRDVVAATDAAILYLSDLHRRFDDWTLALAAYNAGQARVARAIGKNEKSGKPVDYWSLSLPEETSRYVPRLLAVAKVLQDPERYGVKIFPVSNQQHFSQVDVGSQIDLAQAAKMAGVDIEQLYRLNPGFNRWATPPRGPHRLLVPVISAEKFREALDSLDPAQRIAWHRYQVLPGDTLSQISQSYGASMQHVIEVNRLEDTAIRAGQHIMIPVASEANSYYVLSDGQRAVKLLTQGKSNSTRLVHHNVKSGESWWSIANRYGVSYKSLARWNGKAAGDLLRPGDKLVVRRKIQGNSNAGKSVTRKIAYKVRSGDNLSKIAKRFDVNVNQLVNWNNIDTSKYLRPGDSLKIHVAVTGPIF